MDPQNMSPSRIAQLSPLTLDSLPVHKLSFSTQSSSTNVHSETELVKSPMDSNGKKKRTVTFGEMDITELNYHATKTPPEEKKRWKRQAIRRKIEAKEYRRRLQMGILKGCVIFLFFTLCSIIVLFATAQGTHIKI
ncbi:hypothetical protein GCK72_022193 [Caenorhabditis remanei]|uniref:Uncharacterized protein n=1 Tax=Caenorhabditis remanei TaxID=31234 RepID=A0A6A5FTD1_CAERE|nr:hypothetical protein GCK72_022193 [Caenorhabditis remanei]KAF1745746.1 hypothetical protein GCK72_022193 [Caenorhabditis remanei]